MTYREWYIGKHLRRFPKKSWYRYYGKRGFNKIIRANYMAPRGTPIDAQSHHINEEMGYEFVSEQDIVDFVLKHLRNPFVRKKKPKYDEELYHH